MNIEYLFYLTKEFFDLIYPLQEQENQEQENQEQENQEQENQEEEKYDQLIFLEENDDQKIPEEKFHSNFDIGIDIDKNELCYCKEFLFLQICFR